MRKLLDFIAFPSGTHPAHRPSFVERPLVVEDHVHGLREPFGQWKTAVPCFLVFVLFEAFLVPWYLEPGTHATWHVAGIPGWAFNTFIVAAVGGLAAIGMIWSWKDADEDGEVGHIHIGHVQKAGGGATAKGRKIPGHVEVGRSPDIGKYSTDCTSGSQQADGGNGAQSKY